MNSTHKQIQEQLDANPVLLYMKGTPENPECGFSKKAVEALSAANVSFSYVNVLKAPFIRERLPSFSHWPTFPQLFIKGELIGGSDIVLEKLADGSLQPLLADAVEVE